MKTAKQFFVTLVLMLSAYGFGRAQPGGYNTGMPFGRIGPADLARLEAYARREGVDLMGDTNRAYQKDEEALARVFAFSLNFSTLDRNAKTYGQMVYSSFLNLSGIHGIERYAQIVAAQPPAIRQRIRDFIYYDVTQAPKKERTAAEARARENARALFSADYVLGSGNPIFRKS